MCRSRGGVQVEPDFSQARIQVGSLEQGSTQDIVSIFCHAPLASRGSSHRSWRRGDAFRFQTAEPQGLGRGLTDILTRPEIGLGGEILINPPIGEDIGILRKPPVGPGGEILTRPPITCSCDILTRPPGIGQGPKIGIIDVLDPIIEQILGEPKINIKPPIDPWEERLKPGILADPIDPGILNYGTINTFGNNFRTNPLITNNFTPATPTFKTIGPGVIFGGSDFGTGNVRICSASSAISSSPSVIGDTNPISDFFGFFSRSSDLIARCVPRVSS